MTPLNRLAIALLVALTGGPNTAVAQGQDAAPGVHQRPQSTPQPTPDANTLSARGRVVGVVDWGARPGLDGVDGHTNPGVCMCNVPCEVVEVEAPVVIERYGFEPDTGGSGKYRGGLALVRDFRFVGEEAILQVRSDRKTHLPYGVDGGRPGTPSCNVLNPDAEARELPSKFTMTIHAGDVLHHIQPGGGGHGDPFERTPQRVLEDVLDEKLSRVRPARIRRGNRPANGNGRHGGNPSLAL